MAAAAIAWLYRAVQWGDQSRRTAAAPLPEWAPMDRLGFRVAPVHGHVVLAGAPAAVPAGAAPVFEVFADGAVALRRPPPLAPRPGDAATTAAVLLPVARFAELGPAARATALDLVGCLCGERPVPPAVVRADGFAVSDAERSAWLGWLP